MQKRRMEEERRKIAEQMRLEKERVKAAHERQIKREDEERKRQEHLEQLKREEDERKVADQKARYDLSHRCRFIYNGRAMDGADIDRSV